MEGQEKAKQDKVRLKQEANKTRQDKTRHGNATQHTTEGATDELGYNG
jgi:hypothetical protein